MYNEFNKKGIEVLQKYYEYYNEKAEEIIKLDNKNECYFLSKKIGRVHAIDTLLLYKDKVTQNYKFLMNTYKGFFCSVCDGKNAPFIGENKMKLSYDFCRKMVKKNVPLLILEKQFFKKINYLYAVFATKCNIKGEFNGTTKMEEWIEKDKGEFQKELNQCMIYRNTDVWFSKCGYICQSFKIDQLNSNIMADTEYLFKMGGFLKKQKKVFSGEKEEKKKERKGSKRLLSPAKD